MDKSYRKIYKISDPKFLVNFWFYNKKIIIGVIIGVLAIIWAGVSCSKIKRPDVSILYVSSSTVDDSKVNEVEQEFAELIEDTNGDGECVVRLIVISVPDGVTQEVDTANTSRVNTEIINGDSNIIIGEKSRIKAFLKQQEFFQSINSFGNPYVSGDFAVDIKNTIFARKMEYSQNTPLCLMIKGGENDVDETKSLMYTQSLLLAEKIMSEK
ncbi:MAG: hypothetical protein IJC89_03350 [Clostridia bacterium]|nr:hypothetical protein [Clostridia bacterium]